MPRSILTGRNGAFFILIVILLAFAPVPFGSNRPFMWSVNALVVGTMAFFYIGMLAGRPDEMRLPLRSFFWPAVFASVSLLWMVVQILPMPFEPFAPWAWTDAATSLQVSLWPRLSLDPSATATMIVSYLTYGLLFFMVAQICVNEMRTHRFMQAILAIITAHAGIGIIMLLQMGDTMLFWKKWAYLGFATGFFVNRNSFATFLAFGLAIGSTLLVNAVLPWHRNRQNRPLREVFRIDNALISVAGYGTAIAVIGSALLLTQSRMSVPLGAIALLLPSILAVIRAPGRRSRGLGIILGLLIVAVLVGLLSGGGLAERFDSTEAQQDQRWPLFEQTLGMIAHRPLAGFGGGSFADAFAIYHHLPLSSDRVWDRAHNLYLELFADLGVFALGVMAAVVYVLWRIGQSLRRVTSIAPVAAITVGLVAIVHSLVDFSLQIQSIEFIFVAVLAAGFAQALEAMARRSAPAEEVVQPREARPSEAGPFGNATPGPAGPFGNLSGFANAR